ncbi:hypothetical protein HYALB_00003099 [Hymenoscyphus albidus]|uniref:G-patch domain-containing protein n=1 Tax=Hymenoscyphus albidus TaxID=595503 RepID=A0A9N9QBQ4_9HELO|nr:hypothetical protein HYALB_00003099 [Hymenoscyphus albidus]
MNAHALLTSQGWRGTGHSLHPTSDNTGLSRPLLVSRKDNTLGVGKKQHRTSDMWWMNAFDSSLKSLDTSKEGQVVQTNTSGSLDMVKKGGGKYVGTDVGKGLYACFVRGECLSGTIEETKVEAVSEGAESEESERPKKRRKSERAGEETKEERRARKIARRAARAEKTAAKQEKVKKKAQRISKSEDEVKESTAKTETKEERKERRRLKKLAKEAEKNYITLSEKAKKKKRRKDS